MKDIIIVVLRELLMVSNALFISLINAHVGCTVQISKTRALA